MEQSLFRCSWLESQSDLSDLNGKSICISSPTCPIKRFSSTAGVHPVSCIISTRGEKPLLRVARGFTSLAVFFWILPIGWCWGAICFSKTEVKFPLSRQVLGRDLQYLAMPHYHVSYNLAIFQYSFSTLQRKVTTEYILYLDCHHFLPPNEGLLPVNFRAILK